MSEVSRYARAIAKANAAGDEEAVQFLRQQMVQIQQNEDRAEYNPTSGMSRGQRVAANLGAGIMDWKLGFDQLQGRATGADAREKAERDRSLADSTTGGRALQFAGAALPSVPVAMIPGLNTVAASAAIGGASGLMMPTENDNIFAGKAADTALGAVTGGLAQRFLPGATQWAGNKVSSKASQLADAMARKGFGTASRRSGIAERTFLGTVDDKAAAARKITAYRDVPGTKPTTSQILGDPRSLEIERKLRESGGKAAQELSASRNASNQARYDYLTQELDKDPDKLWEAASEFAAKSKGKMRVLKTGVDPQGMLIREAGRLRNQYDNPRAQAVLQEIQDRLRIALAKAPDDQLESLHQLRMYELDDRLESLASSDKKLSKRLGKDIVTFKQALDKRLNDGLRGNDAWSTFLTDYSEKARAAGQAAAGKELLGKVDNLTPTSTGTPNLASNRALLRREAGEVDAFGNPKYSPLTEDALSTVDRSLDVEMRPLAPDIRPAGSATGANLNRPRDEAMRALEPMMRDTSTAPTSVLPQAAGMGALGGFVADPVTGAATAGATMAANSGKNWASGRADAAAVDIAERLFSYYRDPGVALQALRQAVQQGQMPPSVAQQVSLYLVQKTGVGTAGQTSSGLVNSLTPAAAY